MAPAHPEHASSFLLPGDLFLHLCRSLVPWNTLHGTLVPWNTHMPRGVSLNLAQDAVFTHSQDPWASLMGTPKIINGQGRYDGRFLGPTSDHSLSLGP